MLMWEGGVDELGKPSFSSRDSNLEGVDKGVSVEQNKRKCHVHAKDNIKSKRKDFVNLKHSRVGRSGLRRRSCSESLLFSRNTHDCTASTPFLDLTLI